MESKSFSEVYNVILERGQTGSAEKSYVHSLLHKGVDAILKKVGEETAEVIIAAKNTSTDECVYELTDLWFHLMVLMVQQGISLDAIEKEFGRRFGQSGIEEKANRMAK
ncbi:phosphoribosyl-ATP diphosphatase [Deltaproteobacteria bacterium TL4]